MLFVGLCKNRLSVGGSDEIQILTFGRLTGRNDGFNAAAADGSRGQALVEIDVIGGIGLQLLGGGTKNLCVLGNESIDFCSLFVIYPASNQRTPLCVCR